MVISGWGKYGCAHKLMHLWHECLIVCIVLGTIDIDGKPYRLLLIVHAPTLKRDGIFLIVHVSKLKGIRIFPDRPTNTLRVTKADRVDFVKAILSKVARRTS